jgi:SecD/SecF fusion protein
LDLRGGISVTLAIDEHASAENTAARRLQLEQVQEVMRRRVDGLGIAEPLIRSRGDSQVEVQLAGVFQRDNPNLLDCIKKPAKLEFRLIRREGNSTHHAAPHGYEWISPAEKFNDSTDGQILVKRVPELTGKDVKRATAVMNQYGGYEISLEFGDEGTRKFARVTENHVGEPLAIVLDGKLYSAPVIRSAIRDGRASISGRFTQREAMELANVLNNPLEFELHVVEAHELGPTLAEDARSAAIMASACGALFVVLFMVGYYALSGAVAVLSLLCNVVIILGFLAMCNATITLPGIAALVLTIGMAVDSNILIFARIREELRIGKTLQQALPCGFAKAFSTILDANLTTLLTAVILTTYGTGSIRGFGIVLAVGVGVTLFCTLIFCRGLMQLLVHGFGVHHLFPNYAHGRRVTQYPFLRHGRKCAVAAFVVAVIGIFAITTRGSSFYGIDFTGGDEMLLSYEGKPLLRELYALGKSEKIGDLQASFQRAFGSDAATLKVQVPSDQGDKFLQAAANAWPNSHLQVLQRTTIGGSVGATIRWNALVSLLLSLLGIVIYVAFRFETGFAVGAIISTIHDVVVSVGLYALLGYKFSSPMLAAVLMIVGYSINDTIVIFDRIREELPKCPHLNLGQVIDLAINRTLSRTLLTSATTFLAAMALQIFGAGAMIDIARIFTIGIVAGTFSSIYIAAPIFHLWHRGNREKLDKIWRISTENTRST